MKSPSILRTVSGPDCPGLHYFSTTRLGGHSVGPFAGLNLGAHTNDDPEAVAANRQSLRTRIPADPIWLQQIHGTAVFDADCMKGDRDGTVGPPVADAAITTRANTVLAVLTADCLPVVLASRDGSALGVAHAGWRGLAAGVLERTLDMLRGRARSDAQWLAWIGPAISQAHFEVGEDVLQAFAGEDPSCTRFFQAKTGGDKWLADLPALAQHRLRRCGVGSIALSGECTYAQPDLYYSYRRQPTTGRLATLAWLAPR